MCDKLVDITMAVIFAGLILFLTGCAFCPKPQCEYLIDLDDIAEFECYNDGDRTVCA